MNEEDAPSSASEGLLSSLSAKWQYVMDRLSPKVTLRWGIFIVFLVLYLVRVYFAEGWYIVSYGYGIYLLNQLIGFLSPQFDPEESNDDMSLPTSEAEEFRPFARRLSEFKFWHSCTRATIIAIIMTLFDVFDVPVFWPILLLYFIVLFFITMKRQILHMIKYKYVPWNWGKQKYQGK
mmetsp:Transcript_6589/g.10774  ORF Transcript_6589/g.10774 Transcript_6589/m.10774 type:complete len:178 (-) Transcript_6589:166-699(-)